MNTHKKLAFYKAHAAKFATTWRDVARKSHYASKSLAKREELSPIEDGGRWIENAESMGLRDCGFADELGLRSIDHKGWYIDHFCDDTARGKVWQLPGKNRKPVFISGYVMGDFGGCYVSLSLWVDDKNGAAFEADRMARKAAEESREFYAKDQADQDIVQAKEQIHDINRAALPLIAEAKSGIFSPAVCCAIKARLADLLAERRAQFKIMAARSYNFWSAVE